MRASSAPSENPPELIDEVAGDGFRQRTLKVPETLGCLEGHFSGFPVVPAVVQLQWVMELAGEMTSRPPVVRRIEALKFKDLLRPGQVFRLSGALSPSRDTIEFRLWSDGRLFSSGRCIFASGERPPG